MFIAALGRFLCFDNQSAVHLYSLDFFLQFFTVIFLQLRNTSLPDVPICKCFLMNATQILNSALISPFDAFYVLGLMLLYSFLYLCLHISANSVGLPLLN